MAIYRGFSTINELSQGKFTLTGYDLVKQDLLNSLNVRKGSRVMQPDEGCIVWELLYEPLTDSVKLELLDDLKFIVSKDPRLKLVSIRLIDNTDQNSISVELNLETVPGNQSFLMQVMFDQQGHAYEIA